MQSKNILINLTWRENKKFVFPGGGTVEINWGSDEDRSGKTETQKERGKEGEKWAEENFGQR